MPPIRYATARDGTRIAWTKIPGESPPFLHIYTLGAPPIELDFAVDARRGSILNLAGKRATILYDPRGTGFSGPVADDVTVEDLADDLAGVMQEVAEDVDVSVMGTGALPAIVYAAGGGDGWRSLMLQSPTLRLPGTYQEHFYAIWDAAGYREYLRAAGRTTMELTAEETQTIIQRWAELVPESAAAAFRRAARDRDVTLLAREVRLPTLVLAPAEDPGASAEVAGHIPGAVLSTLSAFVNRPAHGVAVRLAWDTYLGPMFSAAGLAPAPDYEPYLSHRELEVLRLLARGHTNAHVAGELVISEATVARHVHNILVKLDCANRAEPAAWAAKNGLA
jgi:DNA-binding CsgD family transcriptional regulator/pimeloyl-ACP methyl ester carboxylesterase